MGNLIDTEGLDQYTDEITTFTSGDSSSPSSFTDIAVVASKEKPSSLFQKLSQAIANIRFLNNSINQVDMITFTNSYVSTNNAWIDYAPYSTSAESNKIMRVGNDFHVVFSGVTTKSFQSTGAVILDLSLVPARFKFRENFHNMGLNCIGIITYFQSDSASKQTVLPINYDYGGNKFTVNVYNLNPQSGNSIKGSIFIPGAFLNHS